MAHKAADLTKAERITFAARLRKLRDSRGWSQEVLAGKAGISQVMVSTLEAGLKLPGWITVCRLATALECSTEEFRK